MNNLVSNVLNENGIILNQISTLVSSVKYEKNNKLGIIADIIMLIPKIIGIFITKYAVTNIDKVALCTITLLQRLFYRKEEYIINNKSSLGPYLSEILSKNPVSNWSSPLLLIDITMSKIIIHTLRLSPHNAKYKNLVREASKVKDECENMILCMKYINDNNTIQTRNIVSNKMFQSNNFKMLTNIINKHLSLAKATSNYQCIPLLLNGEPGLGKTQSYNHLAYYSELQSIRKIDMTHFVNSKLTLESLLNNTISSINGHTAIYIDEIDKYIALKCKNEEELEDANEEMLNTILSFIERDSLGPYSVFIIFCSNNFDTIFDKLNEESAVHYESFKDRFFQIRFNRVDKAEFIEYMKWLADCTKAELTQEMIDTIPNDLNVTFRKLYQHVTAKCGDIPEICKTITSDEPIKLSPKKKIERPKKLKNKPIDKPATITKVTETIVKPAGKLTANKTTGAITIQKKAEQPVENRWSQRSYKDFGPNNFSEKDWCTYYNNGVIKNIEEIADFIISNGKYKTSDMNLLIIHLVYSSKYDKINQILDSHPEYIIEFVGIFTNMLMDLPVEDIASTLFTLPDKIINVFKCTPNYIMTSIMVAKVEYLPPPIVKFVEKLNLPGEMPLIEWYLLANKATENDDTINIDILDKVVKFSYSTIHYHNYLGNVYRKINNSDKNEIYPECVQTALNIRNKYFNYN